MGWQFIITLILAVSIILFPAAFIWYMNIGGIYAAVRESLKRRAALQSQMKAVTPGKRETGSVNR